MFLPEEKRNYCNYRRPVLSQLHFVRILYCSCPTEVIQAASWRFTSDTGYYTLRAWAPVNTIQDVYLDWNMGFHHGNKEVMLAKSKNNSDETDYKENNWLFKVATPGDGKQALAVQEELEHELKKLQ